MTDTASNPYSSRIEANIERFLNIFNKCQYSTDKPIAKPSFDFKVKGTTAGKAHYRTNHISINLDILSNPKNTESMLFDTVGHELAHLFAHHYAKVNCVSLTPHGPLWKHIMTILGLEPDRCHTYEILNRKEKPKPYIYSCGCQEHPMTELKHKRLCQPYRHSICRSCRNRLVFIRVSNFN